MESALPSDDLRPQRPGGLGRGALLALIAHIGLIIALAVGVNWRASEPVGASAELWAQVPQVAAPKVEETPTPAPPPPKPQVEPPAPAPARDAEIALEERKKKAADERRARELAEEKKKAEAEKREKEREKERAAAEAKKKAEEQQRLAETKRIEDQRKANLERMMGQAGTGAATATGQAARDAGPSASYAGRIVARIRPNIVMVDTVAGNPMATVEVRAAPDGTIIGRRLVKSSGHAGWDEAVLRAIDRTVVLPRDTDGRVPSSFPIDFRPKD